MFSLFTSFALFGLAWSHLEIFDNRSYVCRKRSTGLVDCKISFDENEEWDAINDSGCYREVASNSDSIIEWCPLQCQDSPRAYIMENVNPNVIGCESDSFGVLRRKNDWFLWRAEPCDQQDAVFRVSCTRPGPAKKHPKLPLEKVKAEPEKKEDDDKLPETVDALLTAMFPSYRKKF